MSFIKLIWSADPICQTIIAILILFSIWSWAVVLDRYFKYRQVNKQIYAFEEIFWSGYAMDQLQERTKRSNDNPMSVIFSAAINECKKVSTSKEGLKERVYQIMVLLKNREINKLEKGLVSLAIIGSISPFIGLFGMVWGTMQSFQSISALKNTSLAIVAPGIAEALLVTAIGLFAAIPAYIFYHILNALLGNIETKLEDFVGELHTILSRSIDDEGRI